MRMIRSSWLACALVSIVVVADPRDARAAVQLTTLGSFASPVHVTSAGPGRLYVVERAGRIRIFDLATGTTLPAPFLDLTATVLSSGSEQGLLSLARHPDYAVNGFLYVNYTRKPDGATVVERYKVSSNPDAADPGSAATMLVIPQPFANHNGGQLQIGPDGHLYVGMGDGGSGGDPSCFAQRPDSLLGKMLRLDVRQNLNTAPFYGIPADNPFRTPATDPAGTIPDEIWAFGLRNPWRFSFDRVAGDLFIGDVGQSGREEIDWLPAPLAGGANFGWKIMEGSSCFSRAACPDSAPACGSAALTLPIAEWDQSAGDCAVVGGFLYRGSRVSELAGRYVAGDFCSGRLRAFRRQSGPGAWTSEVVAQIGFGVQSFGEDASGELYATFADGRLAKVTSDQPPPAVPASTAWWRACLAAALGFMVVWRSRRRPPRVERATIASAASYLGIPPY